jgi:hypothetical protein
VRATPNPRSKKRRDATRPCSARCSRADHHSVVASDGMCARSCAMRVASASASRAESTLPAAKCSRVSDSAAYASIAPRRAFSASASLAAAALPDAAASRSAAGDLRL